MLASANLPCSIPHLLSLASVSKCDILPLDKMVPMKEHPKVHLMDLWKVYQMVRRMGSQMD